MKTITFDETRWKLVPLQVDEAMSQAAQLAIVDARGRMYEDFQEVWDATLGVCPDPRLPGEEHLTPAAAQSIPRSVPGAERESAHPYLRPGMWVGTALPPKLRETSPVRVAKVRDVYRDVLHPDQWLLDLELYSKAGKKTGRESPACGGPRNFEPACPAELWAPIEEPDFNVLSKLLGSVHHHDLVWLAV